MASNPPPPSESHALTLAKPRQVALRRAKGLSRELKNQARILRIQKTSALDPILRHGWGLGVWRGSIWSGPQRWIFRSFLAVAVFPSLLLIAYFGLIASDQFASEARFAVHAGDLSQMDAISRITGLASLQQVQDSFIVANYVKSRAMVEKLEKRVDLRGLYSHSGIDYFSRFDLSGSIEGLVRYWSWKISTSIENPSGIITVGVRAFSPNDSLKITKEVVALSEELINEMGARSERDLVSQAEREVARAEKRVRDARSALREYRNVTGIIDPRAQAEGINNMIDKIKTDRMKNAQDLAVMLPSLSENSPQVQDLRNRIKAADDQITNLESKLTTRNPSVADTVSSALVQFERLDLMQKVAEKQYAAALTSLEASRITAERQRLYLNTFVTPTLPQEVARPKRFWYSVGASASLIGLWLLLAATWTLLRKYVL
jgi:capsular polysaccharide transport system permease protein